MKGLLFTYALTYGGSLAAVVNPFAGLLVYVCFAIIAPDDLWGFALGHGRYSRIVAISFLIGWTLNGMGKWYWGRARPMMLALAGFWFWLIISSAFARDQMWAWHAVEQISKTLIPIFVALTLIDSTQKLKALIWVIVLSNGFLAYEFNVRYYTTVFIPEDFLHRALDNNGIAITMVTATGLAGFLGLHSERLWQKALALLCAGLMIHVVLFSNSRGGMLALIVTAAVAFWLMPKNIWYYVAFAVAIVVTLRMAGPAVQQRFLSSFVQSHALDQSAASRTEQWNAMFNCIARNPIVGIGSRGWQYVARDFGAPVNREGHSTWLQVAAEQGLPSLFCLASFYLLCMWRLLPLARGKVEPSDPWHAYIARMVIAALVGFVVSAQFVTQDGVEMPYFIGMIGAGVLRLWSLADEERQTPPEYEPSLQILKHRVREAG